MHFALPVMLSNKVAIDPRPWHHMMEHTKTCMSTCQTTTGGTRRANRLTDSFSGHVELGKQSCWPEHFWEGQWPQISSNKRAA